MSEITDCMTYNDISSYLLSELGQSYRATSQNDIRVKMLNDEVGFLFRTQQSIDEISLSYGYRYGSVNKLLSSRLRRWLKDRPDPFVEPWACLYWGGAEMPKIEGMHQNLPKSIALKAEDIVLQTPLGIEEGLVFAWQHKLIDGLSKYMWIAAATIIGSIHLADEIWEFFRKRENTNTNEYDSRVKAIRELS